MSTPPDDRDPDVAWLSADEQELWQSLVRVVISLPLVLDRELETSLGITNYEYGVLARLSRSPGLARRLGELAEETGSTLPRLSKAVTRCEREGWVERRPDPDDRRSTLAVLTQGGIDQLAACSPTHVAQVRRLVFDPLPASAQRQLEGTLSRISDAIRIEQARQARRTGGGAG